MGERLQDIRAEVRNRIGEGIGAEKGGCGNVSISVFRPLFAGVSGKKLS